MKPQEVMDAYRAELRRLYGDEIADKTKLAYGRGWYYLNVATKYRDGSVGAIGPGDPMRKAELIKRTENLRKRRTGG